MRMWYLMVGTYCIFTQNDKDFSIIETKRLCYLNAKNIYKQVIDDSNIEEYNGSLYLRHGEVVKEGITIIEMDDDIDTLKTLCRDQGKRVRVFKLAPFSPGYQQKIKKKNPTPELKQKTLLTNPVARGVKPLKPSNSNTKGQNSGASKDIFYSSGDRFRKILPPNDNQVLDENGQLGRESDKSDHSSLDDDTEDKRNVSDGNVDESDVGEDNESSDSNNNDDENLPPRQLSNTTGQSQTESERNKLIQRKLSKNPRSETWRLEVENKLSSISKDMKKLTQKYRRSYDQLPEEPDKETTPESKF
ncbi:uncharacterized protein LOC141526494 [Cotesia typhae]|uniref:uncharacterized protein LOC141526494 n=1 Tax=Cotesia typhae TaxID=2053667 RepID=UPI003D68F952